MASIEDTQYGMTSSTMPLVGSGPSVFSSVQGMETTNKNLNDLSSAESVYTGPSIVDYLSSTGKASDYASREKLAASKGIQNYAGTAEQNTQLLSILRGVTNNPADQSTVADINKTVSSGGLSSDQAAGLSALQQKEDAARAALANASGSKDDPVSLDYWMSEYKKLSEGLRKDYQDYLAAVQPLRDRAIALMSPTEREKEVGRQLNDVRSQAENFKLQTEEDKFREFEGQTLGFAGGRASEIDIRASFKNQEFALREKNLLAELGLLKDEREFDSKTVAEQLDYIKNDFELQQNIEDKLSEKEDTIISNAMQLSSDSKNTFFNILESLDGIDPKDLSSATRSQLQSLADSAGVPFSFVEEALQVQHDRKVFEDSLKLRQENRLEKEAYNEENTFSIGDQRINKDAAISRLVGVGLDASVVSSNGGLTKAKSDDLSNAGISPSISQDIMDSILSGYTLEEIRTGLATQYGREKGYGYLDTFMQTLQEGAGISSPF